MGANQALTGGVHAAGSRTGHRAKVSSRLDDGNTALVAAQTGHVTTADATTESAGQLAANFVRLNARQAVAAHGVQTGSGWLA